MGLGRGPGLLLSEQVSGEYVSFAYETKKAGAEAGLLIIRYSNRSGGDDRALEGRQLGQVKLCLGASFVILGFFHLGTDGFDALLQIFTAQIRQAYRRFGQKRALIWKDVGKAAKNGKLFLLTTLRGNGNHTGIDAGHGWRMIGHDRHFTLGAGDHDLGGLFGEKEALRRNQFELESLGHDFLPLEKEPGR